MRRRALVSSACFVSLVLMVPSIYATNWAPLSNIDPTTQSDARYPIPAITPDGTAWAFWYRYDPVELDLEVYYSRWNGQSWDTPQTVNPPNSTTDWVPRVAVAPNGALWVLWDTPRGDGTDAYMGLASRWNGTGWTWPDTVWTDGTRGNNRDIYAVSSTEAWFIREGSGGSIRLYHHAGAARDSVRFDLPSAGGYQPTIAVDASGGAWAAWTHQEAFPVPDRLEFSRLVGGSWTSPEILPLPVDIQLPRMSIDRDDGKWIVCAGNDPANTYKGKDIWALRWNGTAWDPPTRISDPIQSGDSLQVHNAVSRTPGEHPRVVWLRTHVRSASRVDVLTSAWDGSTWSPPERVGDLADSTYINWPDVAVRGSAIWVAWMADPENPPYVFNAIATHNLPVTTAVFSAAFTAAEQPGGIRLSWVLDSSEEATALRIYRTAGISSEPHPAADAKLVTTLPLGQVGAGSFTDGMLTFGSYTYWLEVILRDGHGAWIGPRTAQYSPLSPRSRLVSAVPNPSTGGIVLRGIRGIDTPILVNIFTAGGQLVRSIRLQAAEMASEFSVAWDGRGTRGEWQPSGIYFARLITAGHREGESGLKIVLLR